MSVVRFRVWAPFIPKASYLYGAFSFLKQRTVACHTSVIQVSHMHMLKRSGWFYFNRRIRTQTLRITLHTRVKSVAHERAARIFLLINQGLRHGMNYEEIKQKARVEALRLHDEWLYEHFSGKQLTDGEQLGIDITVDKLREQLIEGKLVPDELEDALAYLGYAAMRQRTVDEWRSPANLFDAPQMPTSIAPFENDKPAPLILDCIEDYLSELRSAKEAIKESTLTAYQKAIEDFAAITNNRPVNDFNYHDGTDYRDTCLKLPPNRKKQKLYRGKSIGELLAMELPREQCLKTKTISDNLKYIQSFFAWLKRTGLVAVNPIEGVLLEVVSQNYSGYPASDLTRIFTSPLYGHHLEPYLRDYGRRSRWWLLLLATYTGARLGELCQLRVGDVRDVDGLLCLSINDEESKTLKTSAAIRLVPVHPVLLELGFKDYIQELQQNDSDLVLPGLPKAQRKPGDAVSKWFNEKYRDRYFPEFKAQRKVFHSFRHTFIQAGIKADIEIIKLQQMVGHESKLLGATASYVGEGYGVALLNEELKKIQYPSIDIEKLKVNSWSNIDRP